MNPRATRKMKLAVGPEDEGSALLRPGSRRKVGMGSLATLALAVATLIVVSMGYFTATSRSSELLEKLRMLNVGAFEASF